MCKKGEFGLTVRECRILDMLAESWNEYVKLKTLHKSDVIEFQQAVHQAQNIVLSRPTMRYLAEIEKIRT